MNITFLGNFLVDFSSETHHAKSLESLGHQVIKLQEGRVTAEQILSQALQSDLFIWVHTHGWHTPTAQNLSMEQVLHQLKQQGIISATYHLDLWLGINRQQDLTIDPFYKHIQHFFTVDRLMADWFNANTEVQGHYLRAGVFDDECYMAESSGYKHDIIFVGSRGYHPEWQWRPQLIDWLKVTYQDRFAHYGGDGIRIVRGHELNQLYADTKIVIGDSLVKDFTYPDYWSDRVYETIGRGGFLLMPYIQGLETEFNQDELATFKFNDFQDLKKQIDFYLANEVYRKTIQKHGFNRVKNEYTYKHRWATILQELGL